MWLGRFQAGDFVPLELVSTNGSMVSSEPTAQATAKIYDASGTLIATVSLQIRSRNRITGAFSNRWQVTTAAGTGRFMVVYEWAISGSTYRKVECFTVVSGGNEAGAIISQARMLTPQADYLIHETDNGALYWGRNPY